MLPLLLRLLSLAVAGSFDSNCLQSPLDSIYSCFDCLLFCRELDKQFSKYLDFKATRDGAAATPMTDELKSQVYKGARGT